MVRTNPSPSAAPQSPTTDGKGAEPGWVSGKWRIERLIGSGGMASVYEATHRNGYRVAIKMLRAGIDRELAARFVLEGQAANRVRHPNVVRVLDDGVTDEGVSYLVMELLEGETLAERVERRGPLGINEAVWIAHHVLDVLDAAHAVGIVHRDVKPENVMLTRKGEVKLLDFGIARDAMRNVRTIDGSVMGTLNFMAPEQALGDRETTGPHSDLWSVGALLFTALTGSPPRRRAGFRGTVFEIAAMRLPSVRTMAPEIPPRLAQALDRALAHDVASRVASARAMQQELHSAVQTRPSTLPLSAFEAAPPATTLPLATSTSVVPPTSVPYPLRKAWVPPTTSVKPWVALAAVVLVTLFLMLGVSSALIDEPSASRSTTSAAVHPLDVATSLEITPAMPSSEAPSSEPSEVTPSPSSSASDRAFKKPPRPDPLMGRF